MIYRFIICIYTCIYTILPHINTIIDPEEVFNPKAVDNVVCVWGPPKVPNGEITGIITVPALHSLHVYTLSENEKTHCLITNML